MTLRITKVKYVILGAGPSGLSLAHALKELGEDSFLVLEKEAKPGGLCRSEEVDGSPLDIGGGHFLDTKRKQVLAFLFKFLPESAWQEYGRISQIFLRGAYIDYPLEANLWQLPLEDQVDFLESISQAGCVQGLPEADTFEEWISWKLGKRIAAEYMLPYNRKIWSIGLNQLGTYWLYKLPDVSFRETLQSCLQNRAMGAMPAHANFLYPQQYGYGKVWELMGEALGDKLLLNTPVTKIDLAEKIINGCIQADVIITSIPWTQWPKFAELPEAVQGHVEDLHYSSIDVDYFPETLATKAHWIYDPDEQLSYHRILCRSNFCTGSRGYWTETNSKRAEGHSSARYHNEYSYPLNTKGKPEAISQILSWAEANGIYGLGRWGTWEHMNSDVAVENALNFASQLVQHRGL